MPLLLFCELVADLAGGEAALRAQVEILERHVLGCLVDAGDDGCLILELWTLRRDEAEHDLLARRDILETRKAAGALVVELEVVGVDVLAREERVGNRVVGAAGEVDGVVVAAADVRVDDEVVGASLDGQVVDRHELLGELLEVRAFDVGEFAALLAASGQHAPGAVVELQVAAACRVEVADDRAVARGDGLDERLVRRVNLARAFDVIGQDHLLEELGRCRDRLLGDGVLVLERVHELEVLDERMVLGRERAR